MYLRRRRIDLCIVAVVSFVAGDVGVGVGGAEEAAQGDGEAVADADGGGAWDEAVGAGGEVVGACGCGAHGGDPCAEAADVDAFSAEEGGLDEVDCGFDGAVGLGGGEAGAAGDGLGEVFFIHD